MESDPELERHPVITEYARLALDYDRRWSAYVRATTDATVSRISGTPSRVLDVGCGTGALLLRLTNEFPQASLSGIDASSEMLGVASSRLPPTVELSQGWAEALPFHDCCFDTVISCNMLHYIRDADKAISEMLRVLCPGGTVIITDWCDDYLTCKLCNLYLRWFDPSHFRMYGVAACRELLQAGDAHGINVERYRISWLWGLMTAIARKPPQ